MRRRTAFSLAGGTLVALLVATSARGALITPRLDAALRSAPPGDEIPVIVSISGKMDPTTFRDHDRGRRRRRMLRALRSHAHVTQGAVSAFLHRGGARRLAPLWIVNGMAVLARADVIQELAQRPDVERVDLDATVSVPEVTAGTPAPVEWNLDAIGAPTLWALGFTGQERVVASMDSGVDFRHPDLGPKWRGGTNSWFDPNGEHVLPADRDGHGTWTMGVMVGGTSGGTAIGVAPDARWIAAKIFNDAGQASLSAIHLGFQWLLDPDEDPATDDAPDVVNNSWDLSGSLGTCVTEFEPDVAALETAGIAVVFAGGNRGPGPATSLSPGNYADSLAVGAVDASSTVANFSSRGPSACGGGLYPRVVAPGVNVKTADLTFGGLFPQSYVHVSGTSLAAPHVAGGMALLPSAFPDASVAELEAAIEDTAHDLDPAGPDYATGYGLLDLPAAYAHLVATLGEPSTTTSTTSTSSVTTTTSSSTTTSVTTTTTSTSTTASSSSSSTTSSTVTTTTTSSLPPPVPVTAVLADTYTNAGKPAKNFARAPELWLQSSPEQRIYVRVQVSGLHGAPVKRAVLRLTVSTASKADSNRGGQIRRIDACAWNAVTFKSRLALTGSAPNPDVGPVVRGAAVDFDVTNLVPGDGTYCFAITTTSPNRAVYRSSEAKTGRPQLVVEVAP